MFYKKTILQLLKWQRSTHCMPENGLVHQPHVSADSLRRHWPVRFLNTDVYLFASTDNRRSFYVCHNALDWANTFIFNKPTKLYNRVETCLMCLQLSINTFEFRYIFGHYQRRKSQSKIKSSIYTLSL